MSPSPEEAVEVTSTFIRAVAWGEHRTVWDLFGPEARKTVLRVAVARGMDEALSGRIREGTASDKEENEFLGDLVNGLRADLAGTDLDNLRFELDPEPPEPGRARVVLIVPFPAELGHGLPAGSVELSDADGQWKVERLMPRLSKTDV